MFLVRKEPKTSRNLTVVVRIGWEAGIRTPIPWSRATCPTVGRPPSASRGEFQARELPIIAAASGTGQTSVPVLRTDHLLRTAAALLAVVARTAGAGGFFNSATGLLLLLLAAMARHPALAP